MKIYSNNPIQDTLKWKGEHILIAINKKENPVLSEEDEGRRYEAEFTIADENKLDNIIHSLTRMQQDSELDDAVIYNIAVDGQKAIEIKKEYLQKVSSNVFPALPEFGWLEEGKIYSYANGAVMVRQPHERTIYAPELTPALFSFYREISEGQEWIPQENVELNVTRTFEGKTYKCIQPHTTQSDFTPTATMGVLWVEVVETNPEIKPPQWVSGDYYKYVVGYQVYDSGKVWEAINLTHTWIEPALDGNGAISWKFVKDWVD